jgi:hypothetical protein
MKTIALGLICSMLLMGTTNAASAQGIANEAAAWRTVAATIPLGSKVKIQTANGDRFNATLMSVGSDSVMVKKNARRPEPAQSIAFADLARLERDHGGNTNVGKAIAVGLAAGAGVILGLFAIALQLD